MLRCWNLPDQVLAGDELHAVVAAFELPIPEILSTYRSNDHCLPLSGLARLWLDAGQPLTELLLRLPALLAGLLALWWLPRAVLRRLGPSAGLCFAWLLALSPLLVIYSRMARSYMPVALFGCAAALLFERWWREGRSRDAVGYVLCAALAVYFHPLAAPFVLAPLAFALGEHLLSSSGTPAAGASLAGASLTGPKARRSLMALLSVATALALALASFLLPARESLLALAERKTGAGEIGAATVQGALLMQAGTAQPLLAGLFWLAALCGLWVLRRVAPRLFAYTLTLVLAQWLGVALLSPWLVQDPAVFNRYLFITLPIILLWVACALSAPWLLPASAVGRWRGAGAVATIALLTLSFLAGPLCTENFRSGSFTQSSDQVEFATPLPRFAEAERATAYSELAAAGEDQGALIETPVSRAWRFGRTLPLHQQVHGRRVLIWPFEEIFQDERLDFRNVILSREQALASGARWLVVHRDLDEELLQLEGAAQERAHVDGRQFIERRAQRADELGVAPEEVADPALPFGRAAAEGKALRDSATERIKELVAAWGPPQQRSPGLVAWDLDVVRAAQR
ncbi:MAG: glycosyltransferase family 39 protein [Planctomycetota bacterium]